jgi:hypothetical protein
MAFSMSASWSSRLAFSKMPPQLRAAPLQVVVSIFVVSQINSHYIPRTVGATSRWPVCLR